jgi:hypothetical protein
VRPARAHPRNMPTASFSTTITTTTTSSSSSGPTGPFFRSALALRLAELRAVEDAFDSLFADIGAPKVRHEEEVWEFSQELLAASAAFCRSRRSCAAGALPDFIDARAIFEHVPPRDQQRHGGNNAAGKLNDDGDDDDDDDEEGAGEVQEGHNDEVEDNDDEEEEEEEEDSDGGAFMRFIPSVRSWRFRGCFFVFLCLLSNRFLWWRCLCVCVCGASIVVCAMLPGQSPAPSPPIIKDNVHRWHLARETLPTVVSTNVMCPRT